MNKYVVSYFSLMKGELLAEIVEGNSKLDAALKYLDLEDSAEVHTQEELDEYLGHVEDWLVVTDITHKRARAGRSGPRLQAHVSQFDSESRVH